MSDEQQQPWGRLEGEPDRWYRRYERYRLMEPVRSIAAVYQEEHAEQEESASTDVKRRLKVPGEWYKVAEQWRWDERVAAWDSYLDAEIEKTIATERKKVLRSEFALQHKRVEALNRKIKQLMKITDTDDSIWLADVKSVGTGPTAERVDLVQFNDAAFKELREYLADIADEMGERVKKKEVAYKELPPDRYEGIGDDDEGSEP